MDRPVEEADVAGVDFVLVLNGRDEAGNGGGDEVEWGVHLLCLLHQVSIEGKSLERWDNLSFMHPTQYV